ncbi:dynactin subunit 4-like [Oppia nitens]|uniref:dynactin subunit 4-like n=1 Tax=Oppia nitens TaxID=1686743 RepID=UPI0023DB23DD|nr:dynactin subunit 4-like [Oppia nitens]
MNSSLIPEVLDNKRVSYECTCGSHETIHRIYFCRHCHQLRCRQCVSHEVDSQYCQHCLEYIPSIDAKLKKNKCASCFQCPSCMHTLTTRAIITQVPNPTDPTQTQHKKVFYLICYYCRWSSRDIGIPDQSVASGNWPELETPNCKRLDQLFDRYRLLAQKEKLDKEKKRISPRSAIILLDKYGITPSLSPKVTATLRAKMAKSSSGFSLSELKSPTDMSDFESSVATDDVEPLDINAYYNNSLEIDLGEKATLNQQLMQVESQPDKCSQLYPVSQMLLVKHSLRCKQCDHNLSKPEYNPSSIKFKIQLSAYYHIPELRIKSIPLMKKGEEFKLEMTLQNPTPYTLHVNIFDLVDTSIEPSAGIKVAETEMVLAPKDDTADLDIDQNYHSQFNDDKNFISFRKGNKLGFYINVCPLKSGECKFRLGMKHDFINTVIQTSKESSVERQPQILWITHQIWINLGDVQD